MMNIMMGVSYWVLVTFLLGTVRGQSDGAVRLNNLGETKTYQGIVEVYYNGEWGLICADNWQPDASNGVCRQLGFAAAVGQVPPNKYHDPNVEQKIWANQFECGPDATYLADCLPQSPSAPVSCPSNTLVAVVCADVRLVDTSADGYSGRVEIHNDGEWFGICGDGWDDYEAMVVCGMLFPSRSYDEAHGYAVHSSDDEEAVSIQCSGKEKVVHDCPFGFVLDMACDGDKRAGVSCAKEQVRKEMDLNDDLNVRAIQRLLQLLEAKK